MKKLYDGAEMRAMDRWAVETAGIPGLELMERAARRVTERILEGEGKSAAILCGTGNNGGDGFAAARMLREAGCRADVYVIGDPERIRGDAKVNYDRLEGQNVFCGLPGENADTAAAAETKPVRYTCVVDALFGTGLDRPLEGAVLAAVRWINAWKAAKPRRRVVAVDIPSGIHAGTGQILGDAVRADETITISRLKTGLYLYPGRTYAGKIYLGDIGEDDPNPVSEAAQKRSYGKNDIRMLLPVRSDDSHKGTYGKLLVAAGSPGMMGAAVFAASAAYRAGAGLVNTVIPAGEGQTMTLAAPEAVQTRYTDGTGLNGPVQGSQSSASQTGQGQIRSRQISLRQINLKQSRPDESVPGQNGQEQDSRNQTGASLIRADENSLLQIRLPECSAAVVGPGLGKNKTLLRKVLAMGVPTVVDADALNLIAADPLILSAAALQDGRNTEPRLIFTPHMGEAARLSGKTVSELYQDLTGSALELARRYHAVVVLKNASTVIADPQGRVCVNRTGNNGMSTAGSGDVLAGTIGGLLAQAAAGGRECGGERLFEIACAGVWLHGKAGDAAAKRTGVYALTASDLVRYMRPDRLVR